MHLGEIPSTLFLISGVQCPAPTFTRPGVLCRPQVRGGLTRTFGPRKNGLDQKTKLGKKENEAATAAKLPEGACMYKWYLPIKQQGNYREKMWVTSLLTISKSLHCLAVQTNTSSLCVSNGGVKHISLGERAKTTTESSYVAKQNVDDMAQEEALIMVFNFGPRTNNIPHSPPSISCSSRFRSYRHLRLD